MNKSHYLFFFLVLIISSCCETTTTFYGWDDLTPVELEDYDPHSRNNQHLLFTYDNVVVTEGILSFEDDKNLSDFLVFISNLEDKKRWINGLEEYHSYKSLQGHYINMLDEINTLTNDEALYEYVRNNSTYWYIDETNIENNELLQMYDISLLYYIANKNLQYKVGNEIRTLPIQEEVPYYDIQRNCNTGSVEVSATHNPQWCSNDRRVKFKMTTGIGSVYPDYIVAGYTANLRGQKKISCIWVNYKTNLYWQDISADVTATLPDGTPLNPPVQENSLIANKFIYNTYCIDDVATFPFVKPLGTSINENDVLFREIYGEASSTGVGNIWATINCY